MQDNNVLPPRLVVVDDEPDMARLISDVADLCGYQVSQYFDSRQYVEQYQNNADIIFLDLVMPDLSGLDVINFLIDRQSSARLVLMTGFDTAVLDLAQQTAVNGGLQFVSGFRKPFRFDDLRTLLNNLKATLQSQS